MNDKNVSKGSGKFSCKICDYATCRKSQYDRHLTTLKHITNDKMMTKSSDSSEENFDCICGKKYKHRQGLWVHKKKCTAKSLNNETVSFNPIEKTDASQLEIITEMFQEQMKENKELKELLIEQNKKLLEFAEKGQGNVTNITNNTTNNSFNMQFFLNEQCKNALNIMDFINQLQMKLTDLDMVGRLGYSEGISKIFIRGLKELDVYKRPIHCSDLKREVLYVKHKDSWEKESEEKNKMKTAIKYIAAKNFKQIGEWQEENPEADDYDSKKHLDYHNIVINSMGGSNEEEDEKNYNKIIRNVAKEVTIDKM
jgi:hypothetical protein